MNWKTHKKQLLKNPIFKKALEEVSPEIQIAKAIIEARISNGLSQKKLAEALHTKQSVISRVENARTLPSMAFIKKAAKALGTSFQININP